ncbi:unspecified product [Leishmania tarentolae]|uniref:Unspecified product n=1 Tax=Leishmania tarentolae TaxID=5689 RepID=A0A640KWQ5_LEITA|nr:unspecified product [Leishmania tarentolae]
MRRLTHPSMDSAQTSTSPFYVRRSTAAPTMPAATWRISRGGSGTLHTTMAWAATACALPQVGPMQRHPQPDCPQQQQCGASTSPLLGRFALLQPEVVQPWRELGPLGFTLHKTGVLGPDSMR